MMRLAAANAGKVARDIKRSARAVKSVVDRSEQEYKIEDRCVKHAKDHRWASRKMNGLGFRDWPDRLFIPPKGNRTRRPFWVEFKRVGEDATESQANMHADLRSRGETVYMCDNLKDFSAILDRHHRIT